MLTTRKIINDADENIAFKRPVYITGIASLKKL